MRTHEGGGHREQELTGLVGPGVPPHPAVEAEELVADDGDDDGDGEEAGEVEPVAARGPVAEVGDLGQAVAHDHGDGVEDHEEDGRPAPGWPPWPRAACPSGARVGRIYRPRIRVHAAFRRWWCWRIHPYAPLLTAPVRTEGHPARAAPADEYELRLGAPPRPSGTCSGSASGSRTSALCRPEDSTARCASRHPQILGSPEGCGRPPATQGGVGRPGPPGRAGPGAERGRRVRPAGSARASGRIGPCAPRGPGQAPTAPGADAERTRGVHPAVGPCTRNRGVAVVRSSAVSPACLLGTIADTRNGTRGMIEPINFLGALRKRWRLHRRPGRGGRGRRRSWSPSRPTSTAEDRSSSGRPTPRSARRRRAASSRARCPTPRSSSTRTPSRSSWPPSPTSGLTGNPYDFASGMFGTTATATGQGGLPEARHRCGRPPRRRPARRPPRGRLWSRCSRGGPTPQLAADLANAYAKELGNTIEQQAANTAADPPASSKSSAADPRTGRRSRRPRPGTRSSSRGRPSWPAGSTSPPPARSTAARCASLIGLLGGALLALVLILAREVLNRTIRRASRAARALQVPGDRRHPRDLPARPGGGRRGRPAHVTGVRGLPQAPDVHPVRVHGRRRRPGRVGDPFADIFGMAAPQGEPYQVPEPGSRNVLLVCSTDRRALPGQGRRQPGRHLRRGRRSG